jgi:hypothetical protein
MMKESGNHVTFLAFTENITQPSVVKKTEELVESFDDVIRFLEEIE